MTGPYGAAADHYWAAGWRGVLPLPHQRKKNPPEGYTGRTGTDPSYADIYTWVDSPHADGNIALRLPRNVLGVDVDAYGQKQGAHTLADAEARWGALPPTWRTTSRDDGTSGIRLYRIPEGLEWPGELGPGTELIQHGHRYAVAPPSLHPEGRVYRWINPHGVTSTTVPDLDGLPPLPDTWVAGLTGGQLARDVPRNTLTAGQAQTWLLAQPGALEQPCPRMDRAITQAEHDITTSSAHNGARDGALRAARLANEAHPGALAALTRIQQTFTAEATSPARDQRGEHRRTTSEAAREWTALLESAVGLVTADPNPTNATQCDCNGALTSLLITAPASTSPGPADTPSPDQPTQADRTTWWAKDLAGVISGDNTEPPPVQLHRTDGAALWYRSKINGLLGESESGKTWVALHGVHQQLTTGSRVLYLDFEDTPAGIISRLRALGTSDADLTRLTYVGPEESLHAAASSDLQELITTTQPDLIILDGFNAAMTLLGLDINDNGDATKFAQSLLRPLSNSGAAVVYVDHVPKAKDNRGKGGIGAQAKRAMTTGCALLVDILEPFGRGNTGKLRLTVDKDRPGYVRANSANAKDAGTAILESDRDSSTVTIRIIPADGASTAEKARGELARCMEQICDWLASNPERTSRTACREHIRGDNHTIDNALDRLVADGFVARAAAPRNGHSHSLVRHWTAAGDLAGAYNTPTVTLLDPAASGVAAGSGGQAADPAAAPPPHRGAAGSAGPRMAVDHHTGEIYDPSDWYDA